MTEEDWSSLSDPEDLYGELAAVAQPRKLFQLGVAFLTRVREQIREPATLLALDVTREYVAGQVDVRDLLERWTAAEQATRQGLWRGSHSMHIGAFDCPCLGCERRRRGYDATGIYPTAQEGIRDPAWFASQAAFVALDYACEDASAKLRPRLRDAEQLAQWHLVCDVIGDPFARARPSPVKLSHHPAVARLLRAIDGDACFDPLALLALADALEEAGCVERPLLTHLRESGPHFAGCWAVERVLGREMIALPVDDEDVFPLEGLPTWW